MNSIILDTNVFILFIIGALDPKKIGKHKRTRSYSIKHFYKIKEIVSNYEKIHTCPNVITEVDNLLNDFNGEDKRNYVILIQDIITNSFEKYLESRKAICNHHFQDVGLTDVIVLSMAQNADLLVSADSRLCDIAKSYSINHFDFKQYFNDELLGKSGMRADISFYSNALESRG